jgi:glyoxylase-like metal-dependent hydrolase (beta-lactamase superfamily II)
MLLGDGGNIVVQVGDQGAWVIDAGEGKLTDKVIAAIARLTPKPIQFMSNTSFHAEHVGGNAKIADAGADLSLPGSFFAGAANSLGALTAPSKVWARRRR